MKIAYTRAMINAVLSGTLDKVTFEHDPVFNLDVPTSCPNVPADVLQPRKTWKDGAAYDAQAQKLATMFADNFKQFEATATAEVKAAGPKADAGKK
jgi:phosphoenolpyruvate carboxykinase (ATP)